MVAKEAFLILAVVLSFASSSDKWTSCRVTFPFYWHIPTSTSELEEEFHYVGYDKLLNCSLYSYYDDPRVCILYDFYGYIAGLRVCYIKSDVAIRADWNNKKFEYEYDRIPVYKSYNYWGKDVWCIDVLFLSPKVLKAGGRDCGDKATWEELWLRLPNNNHACFTEISKNQCEVDKQGFTEQNCYFGMGKHYFYNMTYLTDCSIYVPYFLLFESEDLVGLGLSVPGHCKQRDRAWMENTTVSFIKEIVKTYPTCWPEYCESYGIQAFHIFFKEHPRWTSCIWPWQKDDACK